jgi:hypothetical protein
MNTFSFPIKKDLFTSEPNSNPNNSYRPFQSPKAVPKETKEKRNVRTFPKQRKQRTRNLPPISKSRSVPTSDNSAILASALTSLTGSQIITQSNYLRRNLLNGNNATYLNINPVFKKQRKKEY